MEGREMINHVVNIFRHNFLKKVIALIAAFIMWVFVMADQDPANRAAYNVKCAL